MKSERLYSFVVSEGKRALENTKRNFCLIFVQKGLMMKNRVPFWFQEKSSSCEWSTQTIFWCSNEREKSVHVFRRCVVIFGGSLNWNITEMPTVIYRICFKYHLQLTDIMKPIFSICCDWFNLWKAKSWFFVHWNLYSFVLPVYYRRLNMNLKLII